MPIISTNAYRRLQGAKDDENLWQLVGQLVPDDLEAPPSVLQWPIDELKKRLNGATGELLSPRAEGALAVELHRRLVQRDGRILGRREAADPRLWVSLSIREFEPYVNNRWGTDKKKASKERVLNTGIGKQPLMRLWWGAELLRTGTDYSRVPEFFKLSDAVQFLPYRFMRIKPLATAYSELLRGRSSGVQQEFSRVLNRFGGDYPLDDLNDLEDWSPEAHLRALDILQEIKPFVKSMKG